MGPPLYDHIPFPQMSPLLCEMTTRCQASRRELARFLANQGTFCRTRSGMGLLGTRRRKPTANKKQQTAGNARQQKTDKEKKRNNKQATTRNKPSNKQ